MKPKRTILLIDDNEVERSCLSLLLQTRGYRVQAIVGVNGIEGVWLGSIDLALIKAEPNFPESMDGYRLTEGIKRMRPDLPVILYSHKIRELYFSGHQADWFMPKGTSPATLLEYIHRSLIRKRGPKVRAPEMERKSA